MQVFANGSIDVIPGIIFKELSRKNAKRKPYACNLEYQTSIAECNNERTNSGAGKRNLCPDHTRRPTREFRASGPRWAQTMDDGGRVIIAMTKGTMMAGLRAHSGTVARLRSGAD